MLSKKKGSILITGNTAATRGKSHWGFFASTKAAQRILAESIAREFGPKGIQNGTMNEKGAPIYFSLPHFIGVGKEAAGRVTGLTRKNEKLLQTYHELEIELNDKITL